MLETGGGTSTTSPTTGAVAYRQNSRGDKKWGIQSEGRGTCRDQVTRNLGREKAASIGRYNRREREGVDAAWAWAIAAIHEPRARPESKQLRRPRLRGWRKSDMVQAVINDRP